MTEDEKNVVSLLAQAWNAFLKLPVDHPDDLHEFRHVIHRAQEKIAARPAFRELTGRQPTPPLPGWPLKSQTVPLQNGDRGAKGV